MSEIASAVTGSAYVIRRGRVNLRVERRTVWVSAALVVVALAAGFVGLSFGTEWASPGEVLAALTGRGDQVVVITQWRLSRVTAALVFGAALGVSGAIFQNLTNNPLGSPDIIGLDAGAYTGALVAITVLSGTTGQLAVTSVIGGLTTAALIYALSLGSGRGPTTLIVVGIAVNAMLIALNSWIILRVDLEIAIGGTSWSAGSLNGVDWDEIGIPIAIIGVLMVALILLAPSMQQLLLGPDIAVTSGIHVTRLRAAMVVIGVVCTATVTAVAGPIVFIALAAPQIGRRLIGSAGVALVSAALVGAVLLLCADLIAQILLAPTSLPVGVVTNAVGGGYLFWLLVHEVRRRRQGLTQ